MISCCHFLIFLLPFYLRSDLDFVLKMKLWSFLLKQTVFSKKKKSASSKVMKHSKYHQCAWHGHSGLVDLRIAEHHVRHSHLWSASWRLPGRVQEADDMGLRLGYQRQTHPKLTSWSFGRAVSDLTFLVTLVPTPVENLTWPRGTLTPSRDKHAHALIINCLIFLLKIFILILL